MELSNQIFRINKTKNYIKKNNLFFFCYGVSQNKSDQISSEQGLKKLKFNYHKISNITGKQVLGNSIFYYSKAIVSGTGFFIQPRYEFNLLLKLKINKNMEQLFFNTVIIKINNKTYSKNQLKKIPLLEYKKNNQAIYQLLSINFKKYINEGI